MKEASEKPPEIEAGELRKRRREQRFAWLLALGFILSTLFQALITGKRQGYAFIDSLLYFALLHLNVILIMFLVFLVSRNLIKAYLLRKTGKLGSSLRWKMVSSLLAFSLLPSILLFASSTYVIRKGFDRWFGNQVAKALDDAQAITKVHYDGIENDLAFFGDRMTSELRAQKRLPTQADVEKLLSKFPVEAVEIYSDLVSTPLRKLRTGLVDWAVPRAATESLQRAFEGESFGLTRQYGDGDLVQRFVTFRNGIGERPRILVLSENIPLGLKTRIADLETGFAAYKKTRLLKDDLKKNYTLILLTLLMLILFVVSWFGLQIARSVTEPVAELMKATEAFRDGRWDYRIPSTLQPTRQSLQESGADLEVLKAAFNLMAEEVGRRGQQLEEANGQLISLVRELEDRERYLEILLSSIRRGVLVLDPAGAIRRINAEALRFSTEHQASDVRAATNPLVYLGQDWRKLFANFSSAEESGGWLEEIAVRRGQPVDRIFEIQIGEARDVKMLSVRVTGIQLLDERNAELGWLFILEDVSDAARLEKLAAWQEVAKRVAHEIKNPLTPIQISADRLQRKLGPYFDDPERAAESEVFRECVAQIQKQVRVIRDLVREFSQFAKLPEPKFRVVKITELLQDILKDYRFTHPNCHFDYQESAQADRLCVRADPEYLRRLVVNLADNALHSLDESKIEQPQFRVSVRAEWPKENYVTIVFEDNGPGIPAALREKIFDPYVTSKGSGLGLGLPIVRRIAMEHLGRIRCEESTGGRFVLELPLISGEA